MLVSQLVPGSDREYLPLVKSPEKKERKLEAHFELDDDEQKGIATVIATPHQKIDARTIDSGSPLNCTSTV
jgi:hypothetical protein